MMNKKITLNEKGESILRIWEDFNNVKSGVALQAIKNSLDEMALNGDLVEDVKDAIVNGKSIFNRNDFLLKYDIYKNSEIETMNEYRNIVSDELSKNNVKYFSTDCDENNIYITKKLGYSENDIKKYFKFPTEPREFKRPRGKCSEQKLTALMFEHEKKVKEYQETIDELNLAIKLFAKFRFPKIVSKIQSKIKDIIPENLNVSVSDIYYSDKTQGYNIDFIIELSYETYVEYFENEYNYKDKKKLIKQIDLLLKKAYSFFQGEIE